MFKNKFNFLRNRQILSIILLILDTSLNLTAVYVVQNLLDSIINKNYNEVYYLVKISLVIIVLYFILLFLSQYFLRSLYYLGNFSLLKYLYEKILKKDLSFFKETRSGETLSKLTLDSAKIALWYTQGSVLLVVQSIVLLTILLFMLRYNSIITLVIFIITLCCFFIVKKLSVNLSSLTKDEQKLSAITNQYVIQSINGIFDIKQLNKENYFIKYLFNKVINNRIDVNKKIAKYFSLYVGVSSTVAFILPMIAVLLSVYFMMNYNFSVGSVVAIYTTTRMLDEPINGISNQITVRETCRKIEERLIDINEEEKVLNKGLNDFKTLDVQIDEFSYNNKDVALKDINFTLMKGESLLIKGSSGVGKTTISNIIMKIVDNKATFKGQVLWNGKNIYEDDEINIFSKVLKVNQEHYIYNTTLRENILLGDNLEDRLDEIVEVTCLKELILKIGYEAELKEQGSNISGGEKQRIELARILLRRPEFIILDEPTSALNKELSKEIVKNLFEYFNKYNMTAIIISHSDDFNDYVDKQLIL